MKTTPLLLALAALLGGGVAAQAQSNFSTGQQRVGPGGLSTGGQFQLQGSIGQPTAGVATGGNYTMEYGYWSVATVLQTPGAPMLSIVRVGDNLVLSWPKNLEVNFFLEVTPELNKPNWQRVQQPLVVAGEENTVTVPFTPGFRVFRLRWP